MLKEEKKSVLSARVLQLRMKGNDMKAKTKKPKDELLPEYDFDYTKAIRGKYHKRLMEEGANIVVLESDVARAFGNSEAVNKALRSLLELARSTQRLTGHTGGRVKTR